MVAIGRKISRRDELKIVKEGEEEEKSSKDLRYVHQVSKKMFEEKSFDEFKKENLFAIEYDLVRFNYKELFRFLLGALPLYVFGFFFFDTFLEVYVCKRDDALMEKQEMEGILAIRKQYANEILLNNPLFDRNKIKAMQSS